MRRALALALALASALAAAPTARADYNWLSPEEVEKAMEEKHVPAVFFFEVPKETPAVSLAFQFGQAEVLEVVKKHKFVCCRIPASVDDSRGGGGGGGGRGGRGRGSSGAAKVSGWGGYDGLAKELGVGKATALIVCAFDKKVLGRKMDVIKRDDFAVFLAAMAAENGKRWQLTEETGRDLAQVEKWIAEKSWNDAVRRLGVVLERGDKIAKKSLERAEDLDAKLDDIAKERLAEGRRLLDAGKPDEAAPVLEDTAATFAKFDAGKEAKDLLKKCRKA
jgi:hypothetical protein